MILMAFSLYVLCVYQLCTYMYAAPHVTIKISFERAGQMRRHQEVVRRSHQRIGAPQDHPSPEARTQEGGARSGPRSRRPRPRDCPHDPSLGVEVNNLSVASSFWEQKCPTLKLPSLKRKQMLSRFEF
jgi:hypothetical protein